MRSRRPWPRQGIHGAEPPDPPRSTSAHPHPLRLPHVPVLVPRQNREAGKEIVPHMRVERRSHAHLGQRQAVGLGETVELRGLKTIEFLDRSEEHTSELQSPCNLVCRLLLEKKKNVE